ncbi:MAG: tetratricopeptide repeat protein [Bacteroidaceae bacterium]|nr:tetratricopeptide repeat protein [Bacteroidaceae bacterium]
MKKKLMTGFVAMALFGLNANAQYEGSTLDSRIGGTEEHIKEVRGWITLFQDYCSTKTWNEAYPFWKDIIKASPICRLDIYSQGAYMLSQLITSEQDAAKKAEYFKELMWLYDTRLENLAALNSWQTKDKNKSTEGDVLVLKAYYYSMHGPACESAYSLEKAYGMFNDAIESVRTKGGKDVPYYALDTYMRVSYALYKTDNNKYREQFLQDYLSCREVCELMLEQAKVETDQAKAQKIVTTYDPVLQLCDALFAESGAGDREQIIAIFTPKVEENKGNITYLKKALTLMAENNCDDTDCYYAAAEYAYQLEPTYESAIGTAQKLTLDGNHAAAAERYNKAIELASSDKTRGTIALKVATAMSKSKDFNAAYAWLEKAVGYSSDLTGRASLQKAQYLARQEKHDAAIAACDEASAADITLQGPAQRLKDQLIRVKAQIAEYNRSKAEYDAAKRKQQEEEDFWNKGRQ